MNADADNRGDTAAMPSLLAAAHELKAPLVLMRQLTYELGETGLNAEQQRTVERLRLTLERSLRLSQQLTTTSRLGDALFDMEALQAQAIAGSVYDE
ncbi:MAG TPA: hypothetical protein VF597_04050, partial [Candidatus Saccharimonadales bacterium]